MLHITGEAVTAEYTHLRLAEIHVRIMVFMLLQEVYLIHGLDISGVTLKSLEV